MKITFIGAAHEVTGSCTLLEVGNTRFLVDCGMEQGKDVFVNQEIPVKPSDIDFVLLTHAHIDHSGKLPLLVKNGFQGRIYATEATCNLCSIMLMDSAHIQEAEAEWKNRKGQRCGDKPVEPMYTTEDAEDAVRLFVPYPYRSRFRVAEGVEVQFQDAGHLLGSAHIELWLTEMGVTKKIVFSGDVGNTGKPILNDPTPIGEADYVVTESTYGDRYHEQVPTDENFLQQLTQVIQTTLDRQGTVVIPSFAIGRTQELLYYIRQIKQEKRVKGHGRWKVYVDSPLANEATGIFIQTDHSYFDPEMRRVLEEGTNPLFFEGLEVAVSSEESRQINFDPDPKVILSASGMCEAGRVRHHLKHNLWRKNSTILFAGYQANGTLGRAIYEGAKSVKLFGEDIEVNAEIRYLAGISGHADRAMLMSWVKGFGSTPQIVFVNHGEDEVAAGFAESLMKECGVKKAVAPYSGTCYDLITGECVFEAEPVPVAEKKFSLTRAKAAGVYGELLEAGRELQRFIGDFFGRPNADMRKLTREIRDLIERYR